MAERAATLASNAQKRASKLAIDIRNETRMRLGASKCVEVFSRGNRRGKCVFYPALWRFVKHSFAWLFRERFAATSLARETLFLSLHLSLESELRRARVWRHTHTIIVVLRTLGDLCVAIKFVPDGVVPSAVLYAERARIQSVLRDSFVGFFTSMGDTQRKTKSRGGLNAYSCVSCALFSERAPTSEIWPLVVCGLSVREDSREMPFEVSSRISSFPPQVEVSNSPIARSVGVALRSGRLDARARVAARACSEM